MYGSKRTAKQYYKCDRCGRDIKPDDDYFYKPNSCYYQSTGKRYRNVYQERKWRNDAQHLCLECAGER